MAETRITRCPHCQTTFRIRTDQLTAAKGSVRCGSCLQVFKAAEYIIEETSEKTEDSLENIDEVTDLEVVDDDVDSDVDNDMDSDVDILMDETPDHASDPSLDNTGAPSIDEQLANDEFSKLLDGDFLIDDIMEDANVSDNDNGRSNDDDDDDEMLFDDIPDLISDDPEEDFDFHQTDMNIKEDFSQGVLLEESIFDSSNKQTATQIQFTDQVDSKEANNYHDDSWASGLLEEEDNSLKKPKEDESWAEALLDVDDELPDEKIDLPDKNIDLPNENNELLNLNNDLLDLDDDLLNLDDDLLDDIEGGNHYSETSQKDDFVASLHDDVSSNGFQLQGHNDLEHKEVELSITDSINDLQDEPLPFHGLFSKKEKKSDYQKQQDQFKTNYRWLWVSGSLVMLIVILVQISYFKFDKLSRHPDYRPAYSAVCEIIGCQLPTIQDVKQMNTQHFMVRPHPDVKDALYINTLLINNAEYQQPFPDLQLIFSGQEDEVVASRIFKPQEYLAGELAGKTIMPSRVPIHIDFEIMNPDSEAVSYSIQLKANH